MGDYSILDFVNVTKITIVIKLFEMVLIFRK